MFYQIRFTHSERKCVEISKLLISTNCLEDLYVDIGA